MLTSWGHCLLYIQELFTVYTHSKNHRNEPPGRGNWLCRQTWELSKDFMVFQVCFSVAIKAAEDSPQLSI